MTKSQAVYLLEIDLDQLEEYSSNDHAKSKKGSFHIPTARNMLDNPPELEESTYSPDRMTIAAAGSKMDI